MNRAFTRTEVVVCILSLVVVAGYFDSTYLRPSRVHERPKVSRVKADMRSLATAIEVYRLDHGEWPAMVPLDLTGSNTKWLAKSGGQRLMTVDSGSAERAGLTTPVAYLTSVFSDPFAPRGTPYAYYHDREGFILISPGPDEDYDIQDPATVYDGSIPQPSELLVGGGSWTYDPTNGMVSNGDVWRVKD